MTTGIFTTARNQWKAFAAAILILGSLYASAPRAHAQTTAASCAAGSYLAAKISGYISGLFGGTEVPVADNQIHAKEFSLDRLAACAAKEMLHQMTVSTVQWINSGFKGGPAFLRNPSAFFLDTADQVTGQFISQNGPLSQLCSPWNVDIRAQIATEQAQTSFDGTYQGRYYCTLGRIIDNAKNGNINVSVGNTVTDQNVQNFVNGDFSAGGWAGFLSMVSDPGNNPNSAYLYAKSDSLASVGRRQNLIQADLNMGLGFLSQTSCQDLSPDEVSAMNLGDPEESAPPDPSVEYNAKEGKWQRCTTSTPGSTVANMLQKQLNVPATELELADNINAVVNALVNQMVYQVLSKGVAMLSSSGSGSSYGSGGSGAAYLSQLSSSLEQPTQTSTVQQNPIMTQVQSVYSDAAGLLTTVQNSYLAAKSCFAGVVSSAGTASTSESALTVSDATNAMSQIDAAIQNKLAPLITQISAAQLSVQNSTVYPNFDWNTALDTADQAYSNVSSQADALSKDAASFQSQCDMMPK